jgi:hypothetical protein
MKYIVIFLVIFISSPLMAAENVEKPDQQLALEYLTLTKTEDMLNATIKEYDEQLFKNAPQSKRAKLHSVFEKTMGWNATKAQLAELVINIYTKEELNAYIAFIKTPAGKSGNDKSVEFSKRYAAFLSENLQRVIKECCSQHNKAK